MSEAIANPQLRVESQVFVLTNDQTARDFNQLAQVGIVDGLNQPLHLPDTTGDPIEYAGPTTGPGYNESGSPFQVSWSVRPQVQRVNIMSVASRLEDNIFDEDHGHGVRNLVVNPDLLSPIE